MSSNVALICAGGVALTEAMRRALAEMPEVVVLDPESPAQQKPGKGAKAARSTGGRKENRRERRKREAIARRQQKRARKGGL